MNFSEEYKQKLRTAEQVAAMVKSGDWLDFGWCTCTSRYVDEALAKRADELHDVNLYGGILMRPLAISKVPNPGEHFTWNSWHMTGVDRKMIDLGMAYYNPLRYSELPRFYRENVSQLNFAIFQAPPMDEHGYFNFGPNGSHMMEVCKRADVVVVEINPNVPHCLGGIDTDIHISEVDFIVEGNSEPMPELPSGKPNEIDEAVAKLIINEIPNGACLQLGIGGMPNAVGSMILDSDLKDLGVHTEMYVDAFVDLSLAGKITCKKKNLDQGRQVYAFGAGTKKMYDFLRDNPSCMTTPVDYTNDVRVVAQIDNFMSINNIVELDLFGQVNAESSGIRHISGAGGQLDFVMGAYLSNGGKSFLCCSSTYTAKDGTVKSRILPTLSNGSIVTDTRANIHYLVTEYGIVNLKGLTTWQKTEKIISVAHPDFRDELIKNAETMKIWRRSNKR